MAVQNQYARLWRELRGGSRALPGGKAVRERLIRARGRRARRVGGCEELEFHTDVVPVTKCTDYVKLETLFWPRRNYGSFAQGNVVSWNSKEEGAYLHNRRQAVAAHPLLSHLQTREDFSKLDVPTLLSRIDACCKSQTLEEGMRIHRSIAYTEMEADVNVGTALIEMYGKFGSLDNAQKVLEKISNRNAEAWTAMILALVQSDRDRAAFQALSQMQWENVPPNKNALLAVLGACCSPEALTQGKLIQDLMVQRGFDSDLLLGRALILMYGRCQSLVAAQNVFDELMEKDVEAWNAIITAYGRNEQWVKVMQLFNEMQQHNVEPNKATLVSVLQALATPSALADGKLIHRVAIEKGFISDPEVVLALMGMYTRCDCVDEAQILFESMTWKEVSSWNVLLGAFAHRGNSLKAIELFTKIRGEGIKVDKCTYSHIFKACAYPTFLEDGKRIHMSIFGSELERDPLVSSALVNMYGSCSNFDEARRIFEKTSPKDVMVWNAMISAYSNHADRKKAFHIYDLMQKEGVKPIKITFLNLLDTVVNPSHIGRGRMIHSHILHNDYQSDPFLNNALISMYGRCEHLQSALQVFETMPERNIASWNSMIESCGRVGEASKAFGLFRQMPEESVKYDKMTFVSVLGACIGPEGLMEGRNIHNLIREKGLELDVIVGTALINMYGDCSTPDEAQDIFDKLPERTVATWNAIISTYAQKGNQKVALDLFEQMKQENMKPDRMTFVNLLSACVTTTALEDGKFIQACASEMGLESDVIVGTALVDMYGRCGTSADARQIFDKMSQRDTNTWNTMMGIYRQQDLNKEALLLFKQMQLEGGRPNRTTLLGAFDVCAKLQILSDAKLISTRLSDYEVDLDVEVGNVMVNMFVKCGSLQEAKEIFDKMLNRDAETWSILVAAYAQQGRGNIALQLFAQMQQEGMKPNESSLANVLSACSHMGPLEEGCDYFNSSSVDEGMQQSVQQYGSMVNLLGQKGRLDEAEDLIAKTPYKDDKAMWMALLGACRVHGDVDRGKRAAEQLLQLDPQNSAPYIMLSNIYAAAGKWDAKARVRKVMADKGIRKQPGISSVEVRSKMQDFVVRDRSHPQSKEIYAELDRLTAEIKRAGYVPDLRQVLHNVESEEEKEFLLNTHSERLAICYGTISTPAGSPLRIIKNLRVCPDCHIWTKFICKVTGRDIIVRDGKRFHHFSKDGTCSCGDYW